MLQQIFFIVFLGVYRYIYILLFKYYNITLFCYISKFQFFFFLIFVGFEGGEGFLGAGCGVFFLLAVR